MSQLDIALASFQATLTDTPPAGELRTKSDLVKHAIKVRSQVVQKINEIIQLSAKDGKLQENPEVAQEFSKRLRELRHILSDLQSKWRLADLEGSFDSYVDEARLSIQSSIDFCRWARTTRA